MGSKDSRLNSYDRNAARRTLDVHLKNGRLTAEEYETKKLLIAVADDISDLERIFKDLGVMPRTTRPPSAFQSTRGRQLSTLDIVCIAVFFVFMGIIRFVFHVEWHMFAFFGIFLVPMIPRIVVDMRREEEIVYYESESRSK